MKNNPNSIKIKRPLPIFTLITTIFCLLFSNIVFGASVDKAKKVQVLINQTAKHPALDMAIKGIIASLSDSGYKVGDNLEISIEDSQVSAALSQQIASKFVGKAMEENTVVVGVGTIAAQSFLKYTKLGKVKMVFSAVTDPVGAGLVNSIQKPGGNISGVSDFVELEPQLILFKKLLPSLKKLGILYNPGDQNSVSIVDELEVLCPKYNLVLVKQTANKTTDIVQAATKLSQISDALIISNDNNALSAMQSVIKSYNKPVFSSDTDTIDGTGAVAALGPNQFQVGWQTGKMIARILRGANIATEHVEFPQTTELYIDLKAAKKLGMVIPRDIIAQAAKVIE